MRGLSSGHSSGSGGASSARRRPRLVPTIAAAAVVALTASLGAWQLRRADEKAALQALRDAADREAPVHVPVQPLDAAGLEGRRVVVTGRFVAERTVFVDNRTHQGVAGFHVLTPVRIAGSALSVLVLRGWVAQDPRDRAHVPEVRTPGGDVHIEGYAQSRLAPSLELARVAPPAPGERIWQNVALDAYARWSGLALQPLIVRQAREPAFDDGLVRDWPVAGGDVARHRGYAIQWFSMAALAAGLWVYFGFFSRRDDRDLSA